MSKRFVATVICGACAVAALTSCGNSKAGGTGEFATVYASAATPGADLSSDVATWVDATGVKAPACAAGSFPSVLPDSASYTITSTAYTVPNTGSSTPIVSSDLTVDKITLTLTPATSATPALPGAFETQYPTAGQRIPAGSITTVPVVIATDQLKTFLRTGLGSQSLDCSNQGTMYTYRAVVSFEALEVNTNRVATITPPGFILVNFADFVDK